MNALNKSGSQINGKEESRSRRASRGREKSRSRNGSGEVRRGWRRQGPEDTVEEDLCTRCIVNLKH